MSLVSEQSWEEVPLLENVDLVRSGVKRFKGFRKYVDTGSVETGAINGGVEVDFDSRPSRANMEAQVDDVLFAKMKSTEKVYLISKGDENYVYSTGFLILRVKNKSKVSPKFLFYWLRSKHFQQWKDKESSGATQKAIREGKLEKLIIGLPPLPIQERIASILEGLDKARRWRKKATELVHTLLRSSYLNLFYSSSAMSWQEVSIEDVASKTQGSMRTGPFGSNLRHGEFVDEGVAVLGIDNAVENRFRWKQRRYITRQKYAGLKHYRVYPRDVIITIMATTGRSAVIPDDIPIAINTKHLAAITPDENKINPYFLSYSIHSNPYILYQLKSSNRGAIMAGLNLGIIKKLKIRLPPIKMQEKFEKLYLILEKLQDIGEMSRMEIDNLFTFVSDDTFRRELPR